MMRIIKTVWGILNLIAATIIGAILVLIVGSFDRKKSITGIIPRLWARWILGSVGIRYRVHGLENLKPGNKYIFCGNHESAMDIPVAFAALPYNIVFLAKKELFRIPLFGWGMRAAGMVRVNRQNRKKAKESVNSALKYIHSRNINIIVYPEGTRSFDGNLLPFKRGSFLLAIQSCLPLVPVTIIGSRIVVPKKSILINRGSIDLYIDKPIETVDLTIEDRYDLQEKTRSIIQNRKDIAANGIPVSHEKNGS